MKAKRKSIVSTHPWTDGCFFVYLLILFLFSQWESKYIFIFTKEEFKWRTMRNGKCETMWPIGTGYCNAIRTGGRKCRWSCDIQLIKLLKQRLSETETALNNLLKAIEEGIITSTMKQRMLKLEQTKDETNLKLIKAEMKKPTITKEGLMLWLKQIQTMSLETKEHKQRLIDCFVNAVYLYDDKLVITFNYKEASKTVTLKEVNGSIIECSGAPKKTTFVLVGKGCFLTKSSLSGEWNHLRWWNPPRRRMGGFNFICEADFIEKLKNSWYIHYKEVIMAENKLADMSTEFAIQILKLTDSIKGHYSLSNQLERSGTSIGANIRRHNNYKQGRHARLVWSNKSLWRTSGCFYRLLWRFCLSKRWLLHI